MKRLRIILIAITCILFCIKCKPDEDPIEVIEPTTFVPEDYSKIWEDQFDSTDINTNNWVVGSLVDPITSDTIPGARGAHLLNYKYAGYITEENCYIENGALVLRNKEEQVSGNNPWGQFNFTEHKVFKCNQKIINEINQELFKRLYKPFYIPLIAILSCFLIIVPKNNIFFNKICVC